MKHFYRYLMAFLLNILLTVSCFASELFFEVLNVGQADAILIRHNGKQVLVDAGEKSQEVLEILKTRGIQKLDLLVATHAHADHIGGMEAILKNLDVAVFMDNGIPHTSATYERMMKAAEANVQAGKTRYIVAKHGQRLNLGPEAHFEVLGPRQPYFSGTRSDLNANSVVLKLIHGNNCFALMGDAEAETELMVKDDLANCQVLKASHHGSRHSSTEVFLDTVKPQVGIFSCGLANKHGHPGAETIARYEARGIRFFRTDLEGTISITSDGQSLVAQAEHVAKEIQKIDINSADQKTIETLPGIGKGTASAIIAYREANGPYQRVEDVLKASPSQQKRLQKILDFITVDGSNPAPSSASPTPAPAPMPAPMPMASPGPSPTTNGKVNINTADAATLANLPGMSQSKATALIQYRENTAPFTSCQEVTKVKGIGQKTYEKLAEHCVTQ